MEPPDATDSVKGMRGEVLASRALALATLGRLSEAIEIGGEAAALTQGIETKVLWPAIQAVVALKSRDSSLIDRAEELVTVAFEAGAVDLLVCAYRSNPELLATLLTAPRVLSGRSTRSAVPVTKISRHQWVSRSREPGSAFGALCSRAGGLRSGLRWAFKSRDRQQALHQRGDRQGPRSPRVRQARDQVANGARDERCS